MVDQRVELAVLNKLMGERERFRSIDMTWFQLGDAPVTHDIYDEPGDNYYKRGIVIPALWIVEEEGVDLLQEQGRFILKTAVIAVNMEAFSNRGIAGFDDPEERLNDYFYCQRRLYNVQSYETKSNLGSTLGSVTVVIRGRLRNTDADMPFDSFPDGQEPMPGVTSLETVLAETGERLESEAGEPLLIE